MKSQSQKPYTVRDLSGKALLLRSESLISLLREQAVKSSWRVTLPEALPAEASQRLDALSRNARKRLETSLRRAERRLGLRNANRFVHRLFRYFEECERPVVLCPEKEEKIQRARAAYVKSRLETEALRKVWLDEKGDYYMRKGL